MKILLLALTLYSYTTLSFAQNFPFRGEVETNGNSDGLESLVEIAMKSPSKSLTLSDVKDLDWARSLNRSPETFISMLTPHNGLTIDFSQTNLVRARIDGSVSVNVVSTQTDGSIKSQPAIIYSMARLLDIWNDILDQKEYNWIDGYFKGRGGYISGLLGETTALLLLSNPDEFITFSYKDSLSRPNSTFTGRGLIFSNRPNSPQDGFRGDLMISTVPPKKTDPNGRVDYGESLMGWLSYKSN